MRNEQEIGFAGIGAMGEAMALNLVKAGQKLCVWNRTAEKMTRLVGAGAQAAADLQDLFSRCKIIFLMLADGDAMDHVLARGSDLFGLRVRDHILVSSATVSLDYSRQLEADIQAAGGHYVEAPVSGSRVPAQNAQLIAMLAGDPGAVAQVRPLFGPLCRSVVDCGPVPSALAMKFAVNILLITSLVGVAEAAHFAQAQGLDMALWTQIANDSQMASDISRLKATKLLNEDFSPQAAITNVLETNRLIVEAARNASIGVPLLEACLALHAETAALGFGHQDAVAVIHALTARTAALQTQRSRQD